MSLINNERELAFLNLETNPHYGRSFKKLEDAERILALGFIRDASILGRNEFEHKLNRLFIDKDKPKHWSQIMDLLSAANATTFKYRGFIMLRQNSSADEETYHYDPAGSRGWRDVRSLATNELRKLTRSMLGTTKFESRHGWWWAPDAGLLQVFWGCGLYRLDEDGTCSLITQRWDTSG